MTDKTTLTIIKPQAVRNLHSGKIIDMILSAGYIIKAIKMVTLSHDLASKFYEIHKDRPFYENLVKSMTSGPVIVALLEKDNAVQDYREFIGSTNPAEAVTGTIRNLFGTSMQDNAVHGSDSDENAAREASFFFSEMERF